MISFGEGTTLSHRLVFLSPQFAIVALHELLSGEKPQRTEYPDGDRKNPCVPNRAAELPNRASHGYTAAVIVLGKRSWLALIFVLRGTPLARIWLRLLIVISVAIAVTLVHERYGTFAAGLTTVPFSLVGLALGIFLGFRNNTSYDRFWEGRKLWGGLVNTTRTTARQIQTLIGQPDSDARVVTDTHRELTHRVIAYVHCFRHHLRDEAHPGEAAAFLPPDEADALATESNPPQAILHRLGQRYRQLWSQGEIHAYHLVQLDQSLSDLTNLQGACERIKSTPIPASYTVLIHRLVAFYVFALPFGLVSTIGAWTPAVVVLVAYAFLGLDAIGDEIEEPFGTDVNDLPLATISRMIEINLRERLGESDLPEPLSPVNDVMS